MGKAAKALKALWWILRRPVLLNLVLEDDDSWKEVAEKKFGVSAGLPVVHMDSLLEASSMDLGPMTFLDGGSLPTDMMLLAGLAQSIPECKYFEIGTWRGESAATMASRTRSVHTLCLTDNEMRSLGMHESSIASHMLFSKELENVVQLRGSSLDYDFASLDMKFDLIFIDGDHHHDSIVSDTRNVFRHLVHEKSIVVWHDYGFHPDKVRFEVLAAILEGAGEEGRQKIYHVAHTKCAIYTGSDLPSSAPEFPVVPEEYFLSNLKRQKL